MGKWEKNTIKKLYGYSILKANVARYEADIEDIKKETFGTSKSVVINTPTYRKPLTVEDKRAAEILIIERKMEQDRKLMREIETSLMEMREKYEGTYRKKWVEIIRRKFIEGVEEEKIREELGMNKKEYSEGFKAMLSELTVRWYGAKALN